jgi:hypothetical protein
MEDNETSKTNGGGLYIGNSRPIYLQASGAYVHIRNTELMQTVETAKLINGGGWELKRFVPASSNWHPATDRL